MQVKYSQSRTGVSYLNGKQTMFWEPSLSLSSGNWQKF